jgi:hypothetical protein
MPDASHQRPIAFARRTSARSTQAAPLVLIVDNEPPIVELVRGYLDREGFASTLPSMGIRPLSWRAQTRRT